MYVIALTAFCRSQSTKTPLPRTSKKKESKILHMKLKKAQALHAEF